MQNPNEIIFKFKNFELKPIIDSSGNPWFKGKDIATFLEYKKPLNAIQRHINDQNKCILFNLIKVPIPGSLNIDKQVSLKGNLKNTIYINEPGIYSLVFNSKMPEAQSFQNWVYTEVLPSIRQKGEYKLKNDIESLTTKLETVRLETKNEIESLTTQLATVKLETEQYKNRLRTIEQTKHQIIEYNEIIYVLTTDEYKSKNFFKIGGTKNDLKKRISPYNTGKHVDDKMYCVWYKECINFSSIEKRFNVLFSEFKIESNKELYNMHIDDITKWLVKLIDDDFPHIDILNNTDEKLLIYENVTTKISNVKELIDLKPTKIPVRKYKQISKPIKLSIEANPIFNLTVNTECKHKSLKDWLGDVVTEDPHGFVSLGDLKERYKKDFPHDRVNKQKDIERMINSVFNNKGVYLKEVHNYYIDKERKLRRNVYLGYSLNQ